MWQTKSCSLFILLLSLIKVEEIQAQCERPNVGENRVLIDADSSRTDFPEGLTVTFKCSVGYQSDGSGGSRSITCQGKQWTPLGLQCKKKSCGSPGEFVNGRYLTPDGILFGAIATPECNAGYVLSYGSRPRKCTDSGWTERLAECGDLKCPPPPTIQNGAYDPQEDSYAPNSAVTYYCTGGTTLIGEESITCDGTGAFQPSPPQCLLIKCEKPDINNAIRIQGKSPPYGYKQFVEYKCEDGYTMVGDGYLVCDVNGWNPPPPKCAKGPGPGPGPDPDPKPDPKPGPDPDPKPGPDPGPKSDTGKAVGIGVGVTVAVLALIGVIVYFVKSSSGWGKVPTRNEGSA